MDRGARALMDGLTRPSTGSSQRTSAPALAGLRILVGLLWLFNVGWKQPPDFGKSSGSGLYGYTRDAVEHPVFPPYSWLVEHVVLPNFTAFGWAVLVVETLLAVLLLTGSLVRIAALVGIGQSLAIGLSVAETPGEWPWSYALMVGIHVVLLLTASGRAAAVDSVLAEADADRAALTAVGLLRGWGIVVGLVGLVALLLAIGEEALASAGQTVGYLELEVSLGSYNLLGALVLLVVAVLMLTAATLRQRTLALAAAATSAVAALSLYAQLSRADVWLGGSNTSAAFFLCAAVVSGVTAGLLRPALAQEGTVSRGAARQT